MSAVLEVRRLRARRKVKKSGLPWWFYAIVGLAFMGSLAGVVGLGGAYAYYQSYAKDYVPITEKLQQNSRGLTEIYDRNGPENGVLLGALEAPPQAQLLNPVALEDISPYLIQATISTEDNSFEENPGVNIKGLVRAAYENYFLGDFGSGTGGSSITQQLIKNVYICPSIGNAETLCTDGAERSVDRKLREIVYAIELNKANEKDQILEWYLNQIPYGGQYVGIQAASRGFFHKDAKELTLGEAALLAGLPQSPTAYHPRTNCVRDESDNCVIDGLGRTLVGGAAKERQIDVLDLMLEHGRATAAEVDAAKAEDLRTYAPSNEVKAQAWIENQVEPTLVRMCQAGVLPQLPNTTNCAESVHSAGWKVTSTIDWDLTTQAVGMINDFLARGINAGCECYNAAIATIDPSSGQVMVYAPNRDPNELADIRINGDIDQLNEINQPGSSFKPAVYLSWMDELNRHPMSTFWDTSPLPIEGTTVSITNPRGGSGTEGLITAWSGLGGSQNVPAFRAALEAGVDNVIDMGKRLGITTLEQNFDPTFRAHEEVSYGPSIATGGANVRAIDMAYMEATLANMGTMVGVPHYATYVDPSTFRSTAYDTGADYDIAVDQAVQFAKGHIRLPGTRELDPVRILEVRDADGNIIFTHNGPETRQVVNAGSVWLLDSIMSDCQARWIIWGCGTSNGDLRLDSFMSDGQMIPTGVKTGTQQGPLDANDTLETWMTGYSRYAANVVWVGNADNSLVKDGPAANYASANTTVWLFKSWMGRYHDTMKARGYFNTVPGFEDLQPENVARRSVLSPTTERGRRGGCTQTVTSWIRTDVEYENPCTNVQLDSRTGMLATSNTPSWARYTRLMPRLPDYKPELALELARKMGIGGIISGGGGGGGNSGGSSNASPTPTSPPAAPPAATPTPNNVRPPQPGQDTPVPQPTQEPVATPTSQPVRPGPGSENVTPQLPRPVR